MVADHWRHGTRAAVMNEGVVQLLLFLDGPSSEMNERVKPLPASFG
jgi:hypothetical protein